jgi:predicted component of type VI protein secretion system
MTLRQIVERLVEIERKKAANEYDWAPPMVRDVENLRLDIERYLLKTEGRL